MSASTSSSTSDALPTTSQPPQFSLRTVLLLFAVFSVLLAPVPMFGMHYAISMLFSLGILFTTWRLALAPGPGAAFVVSTAFAVIGLFAAIASLPFFFHTLCNVIACLLLVAIKPSSKAKLAVLSLAMLIPYAAHINDGINRLNNYNQLRTEYPIVSIEERISPLTVQPTSASANPTLASEVAVSLTEQETTYDRTSWRAFTLQRLHNDSYRRFVASAGFGFSRMGNPFAQRHIELDPISEETFPFAVANKFTADPSDLHNTTLYDFNNPERIGYVQSPLQVAGFAGHAFTQLPQQAARSCDTPNWELTQLQLVSLLRHATPVAYITKTLPTMEDIADHPHRALNDFEKNSLPQLRTQRDVVIDETEHSIQMLGAVRAGKSCLECHTTHQRGDLLGAFSYVLSQVSN